MIHTAPTSTHISTPNLTSTLSRPSLKGCTYRDDHQHPCRDFKGHTSQFPPGWGTFVLEKAKVIAIPDWFPAQLPPSLPVGDDDGTCALRQGFDQVDGLDEFENPGSDGVPFVRGCRDLV